MSVLSVTPFLLTSLIAFGVVILCLLAYYFGLFGRFSFRKERPIGNSTDLPPVSIIITARDQSHLLINSLPLLLSQEYPEYEVVLVNDKSRDETPQVVLEYKNRFHHLHYVNLASSISTIAGKKYPLENGIQAAKYDILVFTDAGSMPSSPYWLQHLASRFVRKKNVALGHVTYPQDNTMNNRLLHYDALFTTVQAFSYNISGFPVMADDRNLAYKKSMFFKHQEKFLAHPRLPFGEDSIFINEVAKRDACDVAASKEAVVVQPKITFSKWFRSKKYALVCRSYYRFFPRLWIKLYNWNAFLFYGLSALTIALAIIEKAWIVLGIACALLLLKTGMQYLVMTKASKKIGEEHAVAPLFFFDFLFVMLQPWIYIASKFEKAKWK